MVVGQDPRRRTVSWLCQKPLDSGLPLGEKRDSQAISTGLLATILLVSIKDRPQTDRRTGFRIPPSCAVLASYLTYWSPTVLAQLERRIKWVTLTKMVGIIITKRTGLPLARNHTQFLSMCRIPAMSGCLPVPSLTQDPSCSSEVPLPEICPDPLGQSQPCCAPPSPQPSCAPPSPQGGSLMGPRLFLQAAS